MANGNRPRRDWGTFDNFINSNGPVVAVVMLAAFILVFVAHAVGSVL